MGTGGRIEPLRPDGGLDAGVQRHQRRGENEARAEKRNHRQLHVNFGAVADHLAWWRSERCALTEASGEGSSSGSFWV